MIGIYLITEAVGLGIIAWSFKAEDKVTSATAFGLGSCFSLLLAILAAPIPMMLLTALLIGLFRSRMSIAFAGGQKAVLSYFKTSLQALKTRDRQAQQTDSAQYSTMGIIDVEAVEVSR